jgi:release factor glutamine methyltransferase
MAAQVLRESGITEPRREARSLLGLALEKDNTFLVAHPEYDLTQEEERRFREFLARRARREPLQYIAGRQEFYGLDFAVTKDVLIPRPETELIVEAAAEILKKIENPLFCEVGTGSGCISVAILHEIKRARGVGLDISREALDVTRHNARKNSVAERLELKTSDVFAALHDEKFDLIVSNPPYVPAGDLETLQREVRDFEPRAALTDGGDGLSIIERIVADAPKFLKAGGVLLMEIGFNQSERTRALFPGEVWREVEFFPDLQGIPRMLRARLDA